MSLEGGDFVHVPSGAIHVIANASETDGGSTEAAGNVWLTKVHDALVASRP